MGGSRKEGGGQNLSTACRLPCLLAKPQVTRWWPFMSKSLRVPLSVFRVFRVFRVYRVRSTEYRVRSTEYSPVPESATVSIQCMLDHETVWVSQLDLAAGVAAADKPATWGVE